VYCVLDATKAFDKVNYVKLFRILVEWGLPPYIIRVLINMYFTQQACVSWAGIVSAYFPVFNGVRQGGVLSPLLFCVYWQPVAETVQLWCWLLYGDEFCRCSGIRRWHCATEQHTSSSSTEVTVNLWNLCSVSLSVSLSVCRQNAKKAMVGIHDL